MSKDEKEICLYCRWWKLNDLYEDITDEELPYQRRAGECRVSAPVAIIAPRCAVEAAWPQSFGEDWCGKFQDRRDDHESDNWQSIGDAANAVISQLKPEGESSA